jgi:hypothetical protein
MLLGRVQVGALPELGVGATMQLSVTVPVKLWIGVMESASFADWPGEARESVLLEAESAKPGPTVTCRGICRVWLC